MNVYIFQSEIWCESCGIAIRRSLVCDGVEDDGDSYTYPQGPYQSGGGEADAPQHCGAAYDGSDGGCGGRFLENPLTPEGVAYVMEKMRYSPGRGVAFRVWAPFYAKSHEQIAILLENQRRENEES